MDFTSVLPWQVAFLIPVCSIFFFFLGRRSAARDYKVVVTPFCRSESTNWLGRKRVSYETGYRQQLLVKGLPCFKSAEVVLESSTTKEMTREDLIQLAQDGVKALLLLQGKGTAIVLKDVLLEKLKR